MKRITSLFILLIAALITSCSDDDSSSAPLNNNTPEADGEWHLIQVTGSIAGVNYLFEPGTITWTFNDDGTVSVENTNTNDFVEDFFDSGTYEFDFVLNDQLPTACNEVLVINNTDFGCQDFQDDDMILTQLVADGYILKFTK